MLHFYACRSHLQTMGPVQWLRRVFLRRGSFLRRKRYEVWMFVAHIVYHGNTKLWCMQYIYLFLALWCITTLLYYFKFPSLLLCKTILFFYDLISIYNLKLLPVLLLIQTAPSLSSIIYYYLIITCDLSLWLDKKMQWS